MNTIKVQFMAQQVQRFRERFLLDVGDVLGTLLTAAQVDRAVARHVAVYRDRDYPPLVTLGIFVEQVLSADHGCHDAVARHASARVSRGAAQGSLNSGPYCKARQRLPCGLVVELCQSLGQQLRSAQAAAWRWRGREVKLVDGATVSMPDTAENQAQYPQSRQQKAGLGFPVARIVAIISLGCGAVLDWAQGACEGKRTGENSLLRQLRGGLSVGDIVLADRYYAGYFTVAWLLGSGVDVVTRQHQLRNMDFRRGKRLGKYDHIVQWTRPKRPDWMDEATYQGLPERLQVRETRVGGWTLVSSLCDERSVSKADLLQLYCWRWQVELDLRSIKSVMQMDVLRCKTPAMVVKEMAAHLLAYNLVRAAMARAAIVANLLPRQLSFKAALQQLREFERCLRHHVHTELERRQSQLLAGIAQMKLPRRPNRVEPRNLKRRPRNYPLMTKPRPELRDELRSQRDHLVAQAYA